MVWRWNQKSQFFGGVKPPSLIFCDSWFEIKIIKFHKLGFVYLVSDLFFKKRRLITNYYINIFYFILNVI